MSKDYRETHLGKHRLHDETLMLGYGYDPALSEGSVKQPVFLTSTFCFPNAEAGREFFDVVSGRSKTARNDADGGLVYSRFNHPNAQIVEERLAVFEKAEAGAVFSSGMAAISTAVLAHCAPGDVILFSQPLYGGTDSLFRKVLSRFGVSVMPLKDATDAAAMRADADAARAKGRVAMIFLETPSNPLASLADIGLAADIAKEIGAAQGHRPLVAVDNTLLGPVFQSAVANGADLSLYSLTKYVGGHSDLVAGAALGARAVVTPIRMLRALLGGNLDPNSCWMLARSLETVALRMGKAAENAVKIADFLAAHPKVKAVHFPTLAKPGGAQARIFARQCTGAGSLMSFDVGDRVSAFRVLDRLKIVKLAVSLGGTESLVCHPATTVHSGVAEAERLAIGVTEGLIRLSVGIEHVDDLLEDFRQALA
ncbi:MAG: cystathionine gamma-synthase family protein [Methylobacteriaceae bacterium]|nr:cystathionine gamma-synthase family protein [Methylobacteriaceae bacterium]